MNPLQQLHQHGQSVWLDYISRELLTGGGLRRLIEEDGLRGMTSNPSIFQKAITTGSAYDDAVRRFLGANPRADSEAVYEELAVEDIRMAADQLRPVYDGSGGADGFVSLELSPRLARATGSSIEQGRRLWKTVDRPNLMLKVPATAEGIPVVETLLSEGININITLMFSMAHYEAVANAYLRGVARSTDPAGIASVASFFVSRVDTLVDKQLDAIGSPVALALRGKVAVANSKRVYHRFREIFDGEAFVPLRNRGARVQRPLWGSTSTKNPVYSDVLYVEELIGPDTVNTLPTETVDAFRNHGRLTDALLSGIEEANAVFASLDSLGVDMHAATEQLQVEGVDAFAKAYDQLLGALEEKARSVTA
ncbi:MAG: transaldolase [Dehalococcoidia bacterium]|nr:transaldolase [Dehalococcoidia bacterium]